MSSGRPLRFCMITTFYPPYNFGGDGVFVKRLANELAKRGHQVQVIHSVEAYRSGGGRMPTTTYDDHLNVAVHGLDSPFGFVSSLVTQQTGVPFFHSAAIQEILGQGFDVIHFHNVSLVGGPGILGYGHGIKLYTTHEYWLVCPTHVLFRYGRAPCVKPHCLLCSLTYHRPPQWWRYTGFLKTALKHVDRIIAPPHFAKDIQMQMGLPGPIEYLPNFAPTVDLANSGSPADAAKANPYFLFVGRLEKIKGIQTLIPVFQNYKANLLIAGTGSFEPQLRKMAEGNPRIVFLGPIDQVRLQSLYRRAIAVLVPSICYEAFPLVMLEAYRQQTPTIARNLGGMPEVTKESGGGLCYDTENDLVGAMDRLASEPSIRNELGLRGFQAFQLKWTAEAHLERYIGLIHEIAVERGLELS
ncbi:MAG TPA: glycosyltransferase family 4 protein [Anaerolineae bacterium]